MGTLTYKQIKDEIEAIVTDAIDNTESEDEASDFMCDTLGGHEWLSYFYYSAQVVHIIYSTDSEMFCPAKERYAEIKEEECLPDTFSGLVVSMAYSILREACNQRLYEKIYEEE